MSFTSWQFSMFTRIIPARREEILSPAEPKRIAIRYFTRKEHRLIAIRPRAPQSGERTPKPAAPDQGALGSTCPAIPSNMNRSIPRSLHFVKKVELEPVTQAKDKKRTPRSPPHNQSTSRAAPIGSATRSQTRPLTKDKICMHIVSYGQSYNRVPHVEDAKTIVWIDCSGLRPPPASVCEKYTGLDAAVANYFFSHKANQTVFEQKLHEIESFLDANPRFGGCVAVMVSCMMGVHWSVATAERLAAEVRRRNGIKVETMHLDIEKWVEIRRRDAASKKTSTSEKAPENDRKVRWAKGV